MLVRQRFLEAGDKALPWFRVEEGFRLGGRQQFAGLARYRKARHAGGDLRTVAKVTRTGQRIHRIECRIIRKRQEARQGLRITAFDEVDQGAIFPEPEGRQGIKPIGFCEVAATTSDQDRVSRNIANAERAYASAAYYLDSKCDQNSEIREKLIRLESLLSDFGHENSK